MLSLDMKRYVELQRAVGFSFHTQFVVLNNFVTFAEAHGDRFIYTERVLDWSARAASPPQRRNRLLEVRRFALAMRSEHPRHEVPPADAMGQECYRRRIAHIYTADEITKLLTAAAQLRPAGCFRGKMYATFFGILATTGLRVSEALALQLSDVTEDGLIIQSTKFKKSRIVPLHVTTRHALDSYIAVRTRLGSRDGSLFVSTLGGALAYTTVNAVFLRLARSIGLRGEPGRRGARIHDLRHTFAVRSLEQCKGEAVARHLVALSTYLGHAHASDTYWYLQATPILMGQIAAVTEAFHQGGPT